MEAAFLKNKVDMAIVFSERFIDDLYTGDAHVQLVSRCNRSEYVDFTG